MPTRPSNKEFIAWIKSDENRSKVQNALAAYPDLANIKDVVGLSHFFLHIITIIITIIIIYYLLLLLLFHLSFVDIKHIMKSTVIILIL